MFMDYLLAYGADSDITYYRGIDEGKCYGSTDCDDCPANKTCEYISNLGDKSRSSFVRNFKKVLQPYIDSIDTEHIEQTYPELFI